MSELPQLISDLALILIVAGITTVVFKRLRQPLVLGYILAGFLAGPHMPYTPSVVGLENIEVWSQIGVIFLMFSLGLEFSFKKILKGGASPIIAACLIMSAMWGIGCGVGYLMKWTTINCMFLGGMLAMSSTTIIYKAFDDLGLLTRRFASKVMSVLILEDILGIVVMVILSAVAVSNKFQGTELIYSLIKLGFFLLLWFLVGMWVIPTFLHRNRSFINKETLVIVSIGLCFLMVVVADSVGYSTALGAFIIGALIAETHAIHEVEKVVQPIKDMFSAIFFIVVGTMIDPKAVVQYWPQILILCTAVVIVKTIACALGALATGNSFPTSMKVGLGMSNVGEVSFIILALGMSLNVVGEQLYPIGVSVAIATMLGTPFIFSSSDRIIRCCNKLIPKVLMQTLGIYINWYQHTGIENKGDPLADYAKRLCIKNVLNLVSITGIMILTVVLFKVIDEYIPQVTLFAGMSLLDLVNDSFFLVGVILCAPFILITHENHCALAHLIVQKALPANLAVFQKRFERIIYCAAAGALGVYWMLLLSILIFHTYWIYAYALSLIAVLIAYPFRRYFESIYQKAEIEVERILRGMNKKTSDVVEEHSHSANVLANDTRLIEMEEGMAGIGKRLNELDIHQKSGATVISIERNSSMIFNPGGDEKLKAGDHIILLGNTEQLDKAGILIVGESSDLFEI